MVTLLVEGGVSGVLSKNKDWVIYVSLVNFVTNPAANLLFNGLRPLLGKEGRMILAILLEVIVVTAEAVLFFRYRKAERKGLKPLRSKACLVYSLGLNAASFFLGVLLQKLIHMA